MPIIIIIISDGRMGNVQSVIQLTRALNTCAHNGHIFIQPSIHILCRQYTQEIASKVRIRHFWRSHFVQFVRCGVQNSNSSDFGGYNYLMCHTSIMWCGCLICLVPPTYLRMYLQCLKHWVPAFSERSSRIQCTVTERVCCGVNGAIHSEKRKKEKRKNS